MSPVLPIPEGMTRFDLMVPVWKWSERTPGPAPRRPGPAGALRHTALRSAAHPFILERWGRVRTRVSN